MKVHASGVAPCEGFYESWNRHGNGLSFGSGTAGFAVSEARAAQLTSSTINQSSLSVNFVDNAQMWIKIAMFRRTPAFGA
jgi:hypothetical protein